MKLTDEERNDLIKNYAFRWYEIRCYHNYPGDEKSDWERATKMVANEERMESVK